jgi:hypothetical protein
VYWLPVLALVIAGLVLWLMRKRAAGQALAIALLLCLALLTGAGLGVELSLRNALLPSTVPYSAIALALSLGLGAFIAACLLLARHRFARVAACGVLLAYALLAMQMLLPFPSNYSFLWILSLLRFLSIVACLFYLMNTTTLSHQARQS